MQNKQTPFWLFTVALLFALTLPVLVQDGMFQDGMLYAGIAKNLAGDRGSFWALHFSPTLFNIFNGHPPLAFGIQALFFKILGNSIYTERVYSFFTFYDEPDFASHWNEIVVEILGRYANEVQFNAIVGNHQMFEKRFVLPFNPHEDFHDYAFIWTPQYIAWSVDGVEVYRQTGDHVAKMNRPQKLMMNVWPSSAVGWAGKIDDKRFPLQAEYDLVRYYAYEPSEGDTFALKWTDNFNTFDQSRWQTASHTFDTNECVFTADNVVVENGFLKLKLTKPVDEEVEYVPTQYIQTVSAVVNFSKKYCDYVAVRVDFYTPINRLYCKAEFFSLSKGNIKHMYFDIDRKYVILHQIWLNLLK